VLHRLYKDGAKAVKRITQGEFREVANETLTELLGIATMVVKMYALRREREHDVLHLWCVHLEDIALCPHCGSLSTKVHQEEQRCIRHLDVWGKKTFLHFLSRRFKCEDCGRTFTEGCPLSILIGDNQRLSKCTFIRLVFQAPEKALQMKKD
jgi:transposase